MGSATQNPPQNAPQNPSPQPSASLTWVFTRRGILANLPLLFALLWTRGETRALAAAWAVGLALVLLGTAVRVWAQQHIQHRWQSPMTLTGSGPYQIVRNPLYIGNTLIIMGATACSGLLWLVPVSLAWCAVVYSVVVRHEEREWLNSVAREPYGEFLSQVPRWLPRFYDPTARKSGAQRGPRSMLPEFVTRRFGRAVVSELHCFLTVLPFAVKDWLVYTAAGQSFWNGLHL